MLQALIIRKNWKKLEVQSSMAFLIGSILFAIGSFDELQNQLIFKTFFMTGSVMFLIGGSIQLWQTIRAYRRHHNIVLISFNLALVGVISAKAGTLFFNTDSISSWLNLNVSSHAKQLLEPDAYMAGATLFLVSGIAHYVELSHGRLFFIEKNHLAWWSCISQLLGSALYCCSALHGIKTLNIWPISLISEKQSIMLCLIASIVFAFMSLCLLAECSENDIQSNQTSNRCPSQSFGQFQQSVRTMKPGEAVENSRQT